MNWQLVEPPGQRQRALPDSGFTEQLPRVARSTARRIVMQTRARSENDLATLADGLLRPKAKISPKYFYDAVGCELFAGICRLPEYYLTRTEAQIFETHQRQIAAQLPVGPQWVDLGCADGSKSQPWLAISEARRFVGVDIAHASLVRAVDTMAWKFPGTECVGVMADLSRPIRLHSLLGEHPTWPKTFFYPGSSLGNFTPGEASILLRGIRGHLADSDGLLVGIDLVKDPSQLEAAYNDSLGLTAAFNLNVLRVANRLLNATFDPDAFEHCARFVMPASRIEMRLRARTNQAVAIGSTIRQFAAGETILTEYSHKYTIDAFVALLRSAGFSRHRLWTDERAWFGVFLAQP
jgi:dimethylhistidine N-methyltransferase